MNPDLNYWRCTCGNANPSVNLFCFKCRKQRWAQLGFTLAEARDTLCSFLPYSLWEKIVAR